MPALNALELAIAAIDVPEQIRKQFDEPAEASMAESVIAVGIQQPIRVCDIGNGRFRLLYGERRLRAAQRAGLTTIPAIVESKELSLAEILQVQLIENVQRQDLNPLEKCDAIDALMKESGKNASQVVKTTGIDAPTITKLLSLRSAPQALRDAVRNYRVGLTSAYEWSLERDPQKRELKLAQLLSGELTREAMADTRRSAPQQPRSPAIHSTSFRYLVDFRCESQDPAFRPSPC